MQKVIFLILLSTLQTSLFCQGTRTGSSILSPRQIDSLLTNSLKKEIGISLPVFRVYKNWDKEGEYYLALFESRDSIGEDNDTLNLKIKALAFRISNSMAVKLWEINDHTVNGEAKETSIWFWTRFSQFSDLDHDSLLDPILVYGTNTIDGTDYNRVKILVLYKGKKIFIRHQNHSLDFGRAIQVDASFYSLPKAIQRMVVKKMEQIEQKEMTIFPAGWQKQIEARKTTITQKNNLNSR